MILKWSNTATHSLHFQKQGHSSLIHYLSIVWVRKIRQRWMRHPANITNFMSLKMEKLLWKLRHRSLTILNRSSEWIKIKIKSKNMKAIIKLRLIKNFREKHNFSLSGLPYQWTALILSNQLINVGIDVSQLRPTGMKSETNNWSRMK